MKQRDLQKQADSDGFNARFEDMLNNPAELARKYEEYSSKKLFDGKCPYTGEPCESSDCESCDVKRAEREWVLKK